MTRGNENKRNLLGMPIGTATARLRKSILFKHIKMLNLDTCFRCGNKIDSIDELSIEHKVAWMFSGKETELFFDLDNIAFSHLKCNIQCKSKNKFCGKGHEFTDKNTILDAKGYRQCRKCHYNDIKNYRKRSKLKRVSQR